MIVIGESIHVISPRVREAIETRDKAFIQDLARRQVEKGASMIDLNIGPQKRAGPEVMLWIVQTVQEVVNVPLSLDTTNPLAMEAGLKVCKGRALINSTDATPERLNALMPLAAKYDANIIALALAEKGIPTSTDARIQLVSEKLLPAAIENNISTDRIYLDPLVLTVNGNQDQAIPTVETIRYFKQMTDPPCMTTCGLSNVSNGCPNELRPLLNRVFLTMLIGAGLDTVIANALDNELMDVIDIVENRNTSTPRGKLYVKLFDTYAAGDRFIESDEDMNDPEIGEIVKTIRIFENKTVYAHSYLKL